MVVLMEYQSASCYHLPLQAVCLTLTHAMIWCHFGGFWYDMRHICCLSYLLLFYNLGMVCQLFLLDGESSQSAWGHEILYVINIACISEESGLAKDCPMNESAPLFFALEGLEIFIRLEFCAEVAYMKEICFFLVTFYILFLSFCLL